MKRVIYWEPKRSEKITPSGTILKDEFVGKFRTKVPPSTPGAIRHHGTLANGREYDYCGIDADAISGKLRWIDKQDNKEYGTSIILFLESEKYLHRLSVNYDAYNLKDVMNHLCGLGKDVANYVINISYWVRKAKDLNGNYKVNADGKPVWNKSLSFRDISPQFKLDAWKDFVQKNGLEWTQVKKANGAKEWNSDAEFKYWDGRMVELQRFLLKSGTALPFNYNSMICCEAPNPSGGGNLTKEEIELCNTIFEKVREDYKFPFSRNEVIADDAFDMPREIPTSYIPETPVRLPAPPEHKAAANDGWPVAEPVGEAWEATHPNEQDLPF